MFCFCQKTHLFRKGVFWFPNAMFTAEQVAANIFLLFVERHVFLGKNLFLSRTDSTRNIWLIFGKELWGWETTSRCSKCREGHVRKNMFFGWTTTSMSLRCQKGHVHNKCPACVLFHMSRTRTIRLEIRTYSKDTQDVSYVLIAEVMHRVMS